MTVKRRIRNWTSWNLEFYTFQLDTLWVYMSRCVLHHPWKPFKCPSKHSDWIDPFVVQQFGEKGCETISGGSFLALVSCQMRGWGCQIIPSKITSIHHQQHWAFSDNGNGHEDDFKLFRQTPLGSNIYQAGLTILREKIKEHASKGERNKLHLSVCLTLDIGLSFSFF